MKNLLLVFLLLSLWNVGFSENSPKMLRLNRDFPLDRLDELKNIQHDTLILGGTDTVFMTKWEWGIFYPYQYKSPYVQNYYYDISVGEKGFILADTRVLVADDYHYGNLKNVGPYVSDPLSLRWIWVVFWLILHGFVFWELRKFLLWLHRRGRYVTIRRHRIETILSIIVTILLTVGMGWLVQSYFFLFLPAVYIILIFLPARTWYDALTKTELFDISREVR